MNNNNLLNLESTLFHTATTPEQKERESLPLNFDALKDFELDADPYPDFYCYTIDGALKSDSLPPLFSESPLQDTPKLPARDDSCGTWPMRLPSLREPSNDTFVDEPSRS